MSQVIRTGPQEYECQVGVLDKLTNRLKNLNRKKALIIKGISSWEIARPYLSSFLESETELNFSTFNGECTYEEVERITNLVEKLNIDVIIGVGGGKLMDTVKYAAVRSQNVKSVLIPTLASNCAPWTPLSVMYSPEGVCLGFDIHLEQVGVLLIEPRLVLNSPTKYFIAGIADTLAKWYESDATLSQPEHQTNAFLMMARSAALKCKENIVQHGLEAVSDMDSKTLTPGFIQIVETVIAISGLVGGFGDSYARTTIAHAVHDRITIYPESHDFLHGEKVAYGVMVQLAYEQKWDEIVQLSIIYDELGLPKSLLNLHLSYLSNEQINRFAKEISQDKTLLISNYPVSQKGMYQAIISLEDFFKSGSLKYDGGEKYG